MKRSFFPLKENKIRFALFHIAAFSLLLSLLLPFSRDLIWQHIDRSAFYFLNHSVDSHPLLQIFWSLANIKITDLYGALFFVGSFTIFILEAKNKQSRRLRWGYLIFTLIWFEASILFTKQLLTPICEYFKISRHSPTVVLENSIRLSQYAPWAKIKDVSHFCFPSDHAVITLQWCLFFTFFAGWKRGLAVTLFSIVFILPRLISGAHWISDVIVGSLSIVFLSFSWATQTWLYPTVMGWIQMRLLKLKDWEKIEMHETISEKAKKN